MFKRKEALFFFTIKVFIKRLEISHHFTIWRPTREVILGAHNHNGFILCKSEILFLKLLGLSCCEAKDYQSS